MNNSKVFMIIGKSFSGKDTLLNKILTDAEFCKENNLYRLVRYTTRKKRPSEVDGETYNFITDSEYEENFKERDNVSITTFDSEFGRLYYITDFTKLEDNKNYITVADPESIEDYKKALGDRLCIIYLVPPSWEIFRRFSERDDNSEYNELKYKEIYRRFVDDTKKFNLYSNVFLCNSNCIINIGRDYSLTEMKNNIHQFATCVWSKACVLSTPSKAVLIDNCYSSTTLTDDPSYLSNAFDGHIILCDGDITIDTEKECYSINNKNKFMYTLYQK